jgi:hypothetical protein
MRSEQSSSQPLPSSSRIAENPCFSMHFDAYPCCNVFPHRSRSAFEATWTATLGVEVGAVSVSVVDLEALEQRAEAGTKVAEKSHSTQTV